LERGRGRRPARHPGSRGSLAFDQADFAGARSLARFFRRELHALPFSKQLEHGASHRTAVEEMLDSAFVADESKALVDQKSSDRPAWHIRVLRFNGPPRIILGVDKLAVTEGGPAEEAAHARSLSADDLPILPPSNDAILTLLGDAELETGQV
jgi:hypothetical protein